MPKYINILDLRFNGNLNPDLRGLFNEIANKMHGKFNDLVSEISEPYKYNLDWWVEGPASRNTQASPFFYYYCSFHLVDELIKRNYKIYGILVDSEAFRKILKSYLFKKDSSITIKNEKNALGVLFEQVIKPVMKMFLELCRRLYQYMCAYTTKYLEKHIIDGQSPEKYLTWEFSSGFLWSLMYYKQSLKRYGVRPSERPSKYA